MYQPPGSQQNMSGSQHDMNRGGMYLFFTEENEQDALGGGGGVGGNENINLLHRSSLKTNLSIRL